MVWNLQFDDEIFYVTDVNYELDEHEEPVDIQIEADKATLIEIANRFCPSGCNLEHIEDDEPVALYARLDPFVCWRAGEEC